jgi:hypothetical protein
MGMDPLVLLRLWEEPLLKDSRKGIEILLLVLDLLRSEPRGDLEVPVDRPVMAPGSFAGGLVLKSGCGTSFMWVRMLSSESVCSPVFVDGVGD